jgi:hypothetical protein
MTKTIEVQISKPKDQVMADVRRALGDIGVGFVSTQDGGSFEGNGFAGEFRIVGELATVDVRDKPMLLPWSLVESQVRSFFGA